MRLIALLLVVRLNNFCRHVQLQPQSESAKKAVEIWKDAVEKVVTKLLHVWGIMESHKHKTLSEQEAASRVVREINSLIRSSSGQGEQRQRSLHER